MNNFCLTSVLEINRCKLILPYPILFPMVSISVSVFTLKPDFMFSSTDPAWIARPLSMSGYRPVNIWRAATGRKCWWKIRLYFKSKMSTDWTLTSALKMNCFHWGRDNCCTFASNFDLIFCIWFKAGEQKMRPCTFMIFFLCKFAAGRVVSFRGQKVIKDGGHQGK